MHIICMLGKKRTEALFAAALLFWPRTIGRQPMSSILFQHHRIKESVTKIFGGILLSVILATALGIGLKAAGQIVPSQTRVPMVDVIRDVTGSEDCTMSYHSADKNLSLPCPAGSILTDVEIPLSEAESTHEAFVSALQPNATIPQLVAHEQQIDALHDSVLLRYTNPRLHIRPLTNCGGTGYFIQNFSNWHGLTGQASVIVSRQNSACNLYETNSDVYILSATQSWWFGSDQYAGNVWHHSCLFLGNGDHFFTGSHLIQGGFTWEQNFSNNSGCSGRIFWTDVGPLS
jgi:hypothetical protein